MTGLFGLCGWWLLHVEVFFLMIVGCMWVFFVCVFLFFVC